MQSSRARHEILMYCPSQDGLVADADGAMGESIVDTKLSINALGEAKILIHKVIKDPEPIEKPRMAILEAGDHHHS